MDSNELARLTAIKAAFSGMKATAGWNYFCRMSENLVRKYTQLALDEDDPIGGESKRIYAKAMRDAVRELLNAVDVTASFDPASLDETGLGGLEFEPEEEHV